MPVSGARARLLSAPEAEPKTVTARGAATGTRAEARARYLFRDLASRKGWKVAHVQKKGDFLEENEIEKYFSDIGLSGETPDFLLTLGGAPAVIVETKNDFSKLAVATQEAVDYAEKILKAGKYSIHVAIGFAGEADKGFGVEVRFRTASGWIPLRAHGQALTAVPSRAEIELALKANNGTTTVTIPAQSEFIDAAIELSTLLRQAKVEASLRPKVIGAMVAAMYKGQIDIAPTKSLASVNKLCRETIDDAEDLAVEKKKRLFETLKLTGADYERLAPYIGRIGAILERLNIRSVLHTDTDFLGMFYEAFLRYGYDNNALGIVFTPRHVTRFCVDLLQVGPKDKVIDVASGTGGFLVAAFDRMMSLAKSSAQREQVRSALYGFDTNPQIWALATLNMFFRGDGKSRLKNENCLEAHNRSEVARKFTKAFLNPPFSQEEEPERDFIDAAMAALEPEGLLAAVVYAGIFADDEHRLWRENFLKEHTLLGMISMPEDLFYPTAAPTTIVLAKAHVPHPKGQNVFMAKILNDGFEKLKGKRVETKGEQLTEVKAAFDQFFHDQVFVSDLCSTIPADRLEAGSEWSPENWLPQTPVLVPATTSNAEEEVLNELFRAVAHFPQLADNVIDLFGAEWSHLPSLPVRHEAPLSFFFTIKNGKSSGEKNYREGLCPYVSSGDARNSIVSLVDRQAEDVFADGGITITAFGQANLQPWPFMARGNGGSSVRVLEPRFKMSVRELIWFTAQINSQKWRYFYARMAIKGRLDSANFKIKSPPKSLPDRGHSLAKKLLSFRNEMARQSQLW